MNLFDITWAGIGTLFDIPESTPTWKTLAELHGIECHYIEAGYVPPAWVAEIEWFGKTEREQGETEREAVTALIFRLNLKVVESEPE